MGKRVKVVKTWMVEQMWSIPGHVVPIRSVVNASSRAQASEGAASAIVRAVEFLCGSLVGEACGEPVVLYPVSNRPTRGA